MKKFLTLWFLLASSFGLAQALSGRFATGVFDFSAEFWTDLAVVSLLQAAVLQSLAIRSHQTSDTDEALDQHR